MPLAIDVVSDVVCPWCYIGKRRLEAALTLWEQAHPGDAPTVIWHPFELNPTMARAGMDRQQYLADKFGGPEQAKQIYARVEAAGAEVGIPFAFDRMQIQPNTTQAHRLVAWAMASGRQGDLVEALFRGYFLEQSDLTSDAVLAGIAASAGLDGEAALAFLATTEGVDEVRAEEAAAQRMGVSGVPFFVIDQRFGLSGAQPEREIVAALEEAFATATVT